MGVCRQFYGDLDRERPTPLRYADFPLPLEKGAVRLAVLLPPPELCAAAAEAARAIQAILPPGTPPASAIDPLWRAPCSLPPSRCLPQGCSKPGRT